MILTLFVAATRVLTLEEALSITEHTQPAVRQARADAEAADARSKQARGALLPQLSGVAQYSRSTSNIVAQPGVLPSNINGSTTGVSLQTFDFFNFGATLNQQIYDFHQTIGRYQASSRMASAALSTERQAMVDALLSTRAAYAGAVAQRALVQVADDTLASLQKQLENAQAQNEVGRRPLVDLLQAKTLYANGKIGKIRADNNGRIAKLMLNQSMGVMGDLDFDLKEEPSLPLPEEAMLVDAVAAQAETARPDIAALDLQIKAQEATVVSNRGRFAPTLGASLGITERGRELTAMAFNLSALVTLNWQLFSGLTDYYAWEEAQATKQSLQARRSAMSLTVRQLVEQAKLDVGANLQALGAADESVVAAKERLKLAQARYETGVGNLLELADAQVQMTTAAASRVQAVLDVTTARARLLAAVGRGK